MRVVGECFFWYRLTRVFPDKFHRAVKRLCVCVQFGKGSANAAIGDVNAGKETVMSDIFPRHAEVYLAKHFDGLP